jgi:hypothetical protein
VAEFVKKYTLHVFHKSKTSCGCIRIEKLLLSLTVLTLQFLFMHSESSRECCYHIKAMGSVLYAISQLIIIILSSSVDQIASTKENASARLSATPTVKLEKTQIGKKPCSLRKICQFCRSFPHIFTGIQKLQPRMSC